MVRIWRRGGDLARGAAALSSVHYFAKQVMDWKPLQMIVLQMALVPILRVGDCMPIFMAGLKSVALVKPLALQNMSAASLPQPDARLDAPIEPVVLPFRLVKGLLVLPRRGLPAATDEFEAVAKGLVTGLIVADHPGRGLRPIFSSSLKSVASPKTEERAIGVGRALAAARAPILAPGKAISLVGGLSEGLGGGLRHADAETDADQKCDDER